MREIMFRGKTQNARDWIYGDLLQYADTAQIWVQTDDGKWNYIVDPETVCQYTGWTDKKGRKIFEGDIVKGVAYSSDFVGAIVWIEEIAGFGVRHKKRIEPTAWENSSILKAIQVGKKDQYAAEVIGNIFDNPELMRC